jgi:hypothetical protein
MSVPQDVAARAVDVISVSIALGTLAKFLPPIAALFTILWTLICIYESKTFKRLIRSITGKQE